MNSCDELFFSFTTVAMEIEKVMFLVIIATVAKKKNASSKLRI